MASEFSVHLALLTFEILMEGCHSLKEKRRILHGLTDRLRARADVSVAEVGYQDVHKRAAVAVACVGSDRNYVERMLQQALEIAESQDGAEIYDRRIEWR